MNSIIVKIVVHDALADSVVLTGVLNDWLLEVGFEMEDLQEVTVRVSYQILKCQHIKARLKLRSIIK